MLLHCMRSCLLLQNLNKSKEQLNSFEERLKQATVDNQKLQMDLMAKKSECQSLESQAAEQEGVITQLKSENSQLSMDLTTAQHSLECLQTEHKELQGMLVF